MQALYKQLANQRRKLIVFFAVLSLYSLAGFLILPWYLEKKLLSITQDRLAIKSSVESIYFNPFSFYFEVNDVAISELDGTDLLNLSHFHANFQASRLVLLKAQLLEVALDGMELDFDRLSQTENTLTVLAQRWIDSAPQDSLNDAEPAASANQEPSADKRLPAIEVLNLSIKNITANLSDSSLATPFTTTVRIKSVQIDNLSTLLDASSTNQVSIDFEQQSQLDVRGTFSLNPMQFKGTLSLNDFPADIVSRYAQDSLPALINSGRFGVKFNYAANFTEAIPVIVIDSIMAELQSLAITETGTATPFVKFNSIAIANAELNIPDNSIRLDSLTLNGLAAIAAFNSNKQLNLIRMIDSFNPTLSVSASSSAATTALPVLAQPLASPGLETDTTPWSVDLDTLIIQNTTISVLDESLKQPFSISSTLNGSIDNISTKSNRSFPIDLNLGLGNSGNIALSGKVQAVPELNLSGNVLVTDLDLTVLQPYINEFFFAQLQRATLEMDAELAATKGDPFSFRGSLSLKNLAVSDLTLNEALVNFESLTIDAMNFSTAANSFEISEVALNSLFARVIINEDGSSNISRSIKHSATGDTLRGSELGPDLRPVAAPAQEESNPAPLAITVGQIRIDNSAADFTDRNLPIVFNANISGLSGSVEGFATNTSEPTNISLEGDVEEFGLVQINSMLKPFAVTDQSKVRVSFTNISMPAMTPYIIKFAGREIIEGTVDLDLYYDIDSGRLQANNQLVLSDLRLGEKIEYPNAMNLPLDLALALLKDGNGVIDLEVSITGDVNDPEFNFGPAIRRAMGNVLTNIVSAPFRLLGSLVGSGEDSLDHIRFLPGRSDIAAPEREVLAKLKQALQLRPQLILEIPPVFAIEDVTALKTSTVNQAIAAALELTVESDGLFTTRRRGVLENLYLASSLTTSLIEIQQLHTASATAETKTRPALDIIAYSNELRQRLIDSQDLDAFELEALANARANSVSSFLLEDGSLTAQRIRLVQSSESDLDEGGWLLMKFELSSNN
ncbi:MAG: hypothetical protein ACJA2D_000705 [Pseudohongiellaceae bacterium]|jgi:hypothetical protein